MHSRDSTNLLPFRLCVCLSVCVGPFVPGCWQPERVYAPLVPFGAWRRVNVCSHWLAALSSACSLHLATGAGLPAHVRSILYWPITRPLWRWLMAKDACICWHGYRVECLKRVIFCIWRFFCLISNCSSQPGLIVWHDDCLLKDDYIDKF